MPTVLKVNIHSSFCGEENGEFYNIKKQVAFQKDLDKLGNNSDADALKSIFADIMEKKEDNIQEVLKKLVNTTIFTVSPGPQFLIPVVFAEKGCSDLEG